VALYRYNNLCTALNDVQQIKSAPSLFCQPHSVQCPPGSPHLTSVDLFNCPNKQSDSDPIPTWLLKVCASVLTPTITNIVNLSLSSGQFHRILKESVISPLLKKPTLDKDQLSNYRPISNLSLISKIIERVVKSRITDHLVSNSLHNPHQSAYCKHHSTETALPKIISSMPLDHIRCLVFASLIFLPLSTPSTITS